MPVILLAGCTVGPDYDRPEVYEDLQIAQSLKLTGKNLSISPQWYEQFGDKKLNTLIACALDNSPTIAGGIEKLRQARTVAAINRAEYLPSLNASGKYDFSKVSKNIGAAADTNFFQLGLDASWELDIWGAGRRLNEQSEAEFEEAFYSLHNLKTLLTAEVANNYFLLKTAQEQLRIAKNNLGLQRDIYNTVKEKYDAGIADAAAYNQARYVVETTKALIPTLEYQIEAYKNALAVLTGVLPDKLPANILDPRNNPVNRAYRYDTGQLYDLPASIIRSRPDVKAAERALAAQNAAIGQAVAELYPDFSISALFGFQSGAGSKMFNSDSQAYGYVPSVTLPLFNWNKLQNNVQLQKEILAESYQNYRQVLLQAVEELGNAITAVQKEYTRNRSQRNAVYNMQQVLSSMRDKYENGLIEFSDLLKTEQDLLQAQTTLAASNGAIYQNIIAFYKATGGGYN